MNELKTFVQKAGKNCKNIVIIKLVLLRSVFNNDL